MKWIYIFNLLNKIKQYQINIKLPKIEKILKLDIKTLEYLVKMDIERLEIALNYAIENSNINCLSIIKSIKNNNYLNDIEELINNKNINIKSNIYINEAINILQNAKCEYVASNLKEILENPLIIFNNDDENIALYYADYLLNYNDLNLLNYKILANIINDTYFIKNDLNKYFVQILDNTDENEVLEAKKILKSYFSYKSHFKAFFNYLLKSKPIDDIEAKQYLVIIINILNKFMNNIKQEEIMDIINKIFNSNYDIKNENFKKNNINYFLKIFIYYWKCNCNNEINEDTINNLNCIIDNLKFLNNNECLVKTKSQSQSFS